MFDYETTADAIALALWKSDTGNGATLHPDLWDAHMENCHAAAANTYHDGLNVNDWYAAAWVRLHRAAA